MVIYVPIDTEDLKRLWEPFEVLKKAGYDFTSWKRGKRTAPVTLFDLRDQLTSLHSKITTDRGSVHAAVSEDDYLTLMNVERVLGKWPGGSWHLEYIDRVQMPIRIKLGEQPYLFAAWEIGTHEIFPNPWRVEASDGRNEDPPRGIKVRGINHSRARDIGTCLTDMGIEKEVTSEGAPEDGVHFDFEEMGLFEQFVGQLMKEDYRTTTRPEVIAQA